MSPRSFKRARQRDLAGQTRREQLRTRRVRLGAVAVGAFALAAPASAAADFEVQTLGDGTANPCTVPPDCTTLRDAIAAANVAAGADVITFESSLSGTVRLTEGELQIMSGDAAATTIDGGDEITISGDADNSGTQNTGDSRIFATFTPTTIMELTLTGGFGDNSPGGAILNFDTDLVVADSTISGNAALGSGTGSGGGIAQGGDPKYDNASITVSDSTISGNVAGGGSGGGINTSLGKYTPLTVIDSVITGNGTSGAGGGISQAGKYSPLDISGSVISNNGADANGGGISFGANSNASPAPANSEIIDTTISGNDAPYGAGINLFSLKAGDELTIDGTTISGNQGGAGSQGGGIRVAGSLAGALDLIDSTISGNSAETGAGAALGATGTPLITGTGSLGFDSTTIAGNTAAVRGGGIYLPSYGTGPQTADVPLTNTIVADNTAAGSPQDLDRADDATTTGGFEISFTLVEAPGDGDVSETPSGSSIVGSDPKLGPLANNGGPTLTRILYQTSPALDQGMASGLDQRGATFARPVDLAGIPSTTGGNEADMGALEAQTLPPLPPPPDTGPNQATTGKPGFDLKAAFRKCKQKFKRGTEKRRKCNRKARARAKENAKL